MQQGYSSDTHPAQRKGKEWGSGHSSYAALAIDAEGGGADIVGPDLLFFFLSREPKNVRFLHGGSGVKNEQ